MRHNSVSPRFLSAQILKKEEEICQIVDRGYLLSGGMQVNSSLCFQFLSPFYALYFVVLYTYLPYF